MKGKECKGDRGKESKREGGEREGGGRGKGRKRTERRQEKNRRVGSQQGALTITDLSIFGSILILPEGRILLGGLQLIRELVTGVCEGGDI